MRVRIKSRRKSNVSNRVNFNVSRGDDDFHRNIHEKRQRDSDKFNNREMEKRQSRIYYGRHKIPRTIDDDSVVLDEDVNHEFCDENILVPHSKIRKSFERGMKEMAKVNRGKKRKTARNNKNIKVKKSILADIVKDENKVLRITKIDIEEKQTEKPGGFKRFLRAINPLTYMRKAYNFIKAKLTSKKAKKIFRKIKKGIMTVLNYTILFPVVFISRLIERRIEATDIGVAEA